MFYDHVFNHDEKQMLLGLAESNYLIKVDCPDYLKKSKHAIEIRHTINHRGKDRRSGNITTSFVPRIHATTVQRLVREVRNTASVSCSRQLAKLFELGLGVPKQPDIAAYLHDYSRENDKKGVGIKYIHKLINEYHRKHRHSFADSRWLMPAAYTANMLNMQSFIHLKENGYKKKVAVPDGVPVVLVYQSTNYETAQFTLCDAFAISPLGYPMPFAQIALRPEFTGAPKTFKSKALRGKGMYSMIMGVMYWDKGAARDNFQELMDIDADQYLNLLDSDKYADRRSEKYQAALAQRAEMNADRQKWQAVIDKYGKTTRTLKPEQAELLDQAQAYFLARADKGNFIKKFESVERKENTEAADRFAVAKAKFAAVDCGTIMDRTTYMAVSSSLDMVHTILGKWGFTTVTSVNNSLKKSLLTYTTKNVSRVWSV